MNFHPVLSGRFPWFLGRTLAGILILNLGGVACSYSAILANFSDGNTSSSVDGFVGMAGSGWAGAWTTKTTNMTLNSATVVTDGSALATGAGNYLAISTSAAAGASGPAMSVNRQYGAAGGEVSLASPVTYSFLFRPDAGSSADYRYSIFDTTASQTGTSASNTWAIVATGGQWQVYNGSTLTSTGLSVTLGEVYSFTIVADPTNREWSVQIADTNGSVLYLSDSLSFRSTTATSMGGYLTFAAADTGSSTASDYGFSIDSIAIVPEPTTLVFVTLGLIGVAFIKRREAAAL